MTDMTGPAAETEAAAPAQVAGRVVVGVDGSDGSVAALRWAMTEARLRGTSVLAVIAWTYHASWGRASRVHMTPPPSAVLPGANPTGQRPPPRFEPSEETDQAGAVESVLESSVVRAIREQDEQGRQHHVEISRQAIEGHPAEVLLGAATPSDLLVVGYRGHGGFIGALLGSVSHHIVTHARCPVVVVPVPHHDEAHQERT
jgi:nucleotide-binding universal stress UspA family protein